jgi:hypothetical protein
VKLLPRKRIEPAIEQFNEKHRDELVRKPEYYFETIGNLDRYSHLEKQRLYTTFSQKELMKDLPRTWR